jgi:hypothetical protein
MLPAAILRRLFGNQRPAGGNVCADGEARVFGVDDAFDDEWPVPFGARPI